VSKKKHRPVKKYDELSNTEAFVWLWINDPEERFMWFQAYLVALIWGGDELQHSVADNLADYGLAVQEGSVFVYIDEIEYEAYLEKVKYEKS